MRTWQVVLLLNLALAVGLGLGYGFWGRNRLELDGEIQTLQERADQLQRERDALAAGAKVGMQQWEGLGIVRGAYPQLIVITHEDIKGLLPARTTGFRVAGPIDRSLTKTGAAIRFWLQGTDPDDSVVARLAAW